MKLIGRLFARRWWYVAALVGVLVLTLMVLDRLYPLPQQRSFSSVVVAADGELLRAFSNARQEWRYPLALSQVPDDYREMLLAYEDRWYNWHFGVNPLAIVRASWQ
ncbi:MAG: transglycosylase domain-containing protein, partial [Pseudomonadales bacterium]